MRQVRFLRFLVLTFLLLGVTVVWARPALAVDETVTSVSLSSNKVTPGFALQFSVHNLPNVRQNVNRNEPVPIPRDWLVEIGQDEAYPSGIYGVKTVYFPDTDLIKDADDVYTFPAPNEPGYYRIGIKSGVGDWSAFEYFQVVAEPFVTVRPPRSFAQGATVSLRIYNAQGQPWNIDSWGNRAGQYNIDVYSFGNGGPIGYASPDGTRAVRIQRTGSGLYTFPASQTIGEYYVGFNVGAATALHSTSFDVIRVENQGENNREENGDSVPLPPQLDPYPDTSTSTRDVDEPLSRWRNTTSTSNNTNEANRQFTCPLDIGKAYKARNSSAVYLIVAPRRTDGSIDTGRSTCTRRAFLNSRIFFTYFSNWSEVLVDDRVNQISNDQLGFLPWGRKYDPKYGALVKVVNDPKVYLLLGGQKYWISDENVFSRLRYSGSWIEDVSEELLELYEDGGSIVDTTRHPNYTLVKYANDSRVYRLEPDPNDSTRTVKRHIADEQTFDSLGYRADRIITIADTETYANGETLRRQIRLEP